MKKFICILLLLNLLYSDQIFASKKKKLFQELIKVYKKENILRHLHYAPNQKWIFLRHKEKFRTTFKKPISKSDNFL